jgi:membrane-associated protein
MHILTSLSEPLIYLVAFAIIFAESGFIFFFFLPGDTLLFALGIFASQGIVSTGVIIGVLIVAALLGNLVAYYLGSFIRDKRETSKVLRKVPEKYIIKTESFYQKYGSWTVVLSRFIPVVRTVAPFLAGVSHMNYKKYTTFSVLGGTAWVVAVTFLGFILGGQFSISGGFNLAVGLMIAASVGFPLLIFISKRYFKKS